MHRTVVLMLIEHAMYHLQIEAPSVSSVLPRAVVCYYCAPAHPENVMQKLYTSPFSHINLEVVHVLCAVFEIGELPVIRLIIL